MSLTHLPKIFQTLHNKEVSFSYTRNGELYFPTYSFGSCWANRKATKFRHHRTLDEIVATNCASLVGQTKSVITIAAHRRRYAQTFLFEETQHQDFVTACQDEGETTFKVFFKGMKFNYT